MTPPIIIALSGLSEAGKTETIEALLLIISGSFQPGAYGYVDVHPFAEHVKQAATESFGWTGEKTPKDRALLEGITMLREEYDPGGWARDWAEAQLKCPWRATPTFILVDDHRGVPGFDALIDAHGGWRFTINRDADSPIGVPRDTSIQERLPGNLQLRHWDSLARRAGIPIANNADDHGAAAAAEIWRQVKQRMDSAR